MMVGSLRKENIDFLIGLMIVLPIFFQVTGEVGLFKGVHRAQGLVVPLSIFILPLMALSLFRGSKVLVHLDDCYLFFIFGFFVWVASLGLYSSASTDPTAMLYAVQWMLPFCAAFYGAALVSRERRFQKFLRGFLLGTVVSILFVITLACIEAIFLGGLFQWRMKQNAVIPGLYQLYNYVPIGIALSVLFCIGMLEYRRGFHVRVLKWTLWSLCFVFLVLVSTRGPLLLFLLCSLYFIFFMRGGPIVVFFLIGMSLVGIIIAIAVGFHPKGFLMFERIMWMFGVGGGGGESRIGKRDIMLGHAFEIYDKNVFLGTAMAPSGFSSAHNYYIDTLLWSGPLGLTLMLGLVFLISRGALKFLFVRPRSGTGNGLISLCHVTVPLILGIFLVSNNLRVPMRQPYSGILIFLFIGIFLGALRGLRKGRSLVPVRGTNKMNDIFKRL